MSSGSIGGIWVDVALKFPDLGKSVQGVGSAFRSVGVHIGAGIGAAIRGSTAAIAGRPWEPHWAARSGSSPLAFKWP
jgi:hypothetical protein